MSNLKISQLTEKTTIVENDVLTILDSADNYANKKVLASAMVIKQKQVSDTSNTTATINVLENTRYVYNQPLTALTISSVENSLSESEIDFTTSTSFTFTATPLTNKWIDQAPTWIANTHYIIVIKSGYASWGIVGY